VVSRQRGYTLLEVVVAMAVFTAIVAIFAIITSEMRAHQKRLPMNLMRHPQVSAVVSRMRRDVQDAYTANPYLDEHDGYTMGEKTLIVQSMQPYGGRETIVWDFREAGLVRRRAYRVGVATEWVARGLPPGVAINLDAVDIEGRPWGVRVIARDAEGQVAIDQILQPRAH